MKDSRLANFGNAATRLAEAVTSEGAYARGADPDVDALFKQQARETDRRKREAMLHKLQQLVYDRVRFGPVECVFHVEGTSNNIRLPITSSQRIMAPVLEEDEPQSKSLVVATMAFLGTIAVLFAIYKFLMGR